MSYATEVAADSPLHWFKLDETSGTSLANAGSNGTALTKAAGMTLNQADTISSGGKSAALDGSATSYASATSQFGQYPSAGATYEIWYKGTDASGTIARWGSGSTNYWAIKVVSGGFVSFTRATQVHTATSGVVNDGAWHHIVVNYTNATGTYNIYVDKTLVYTTTGASVPNLNANQTLFLGDDTDSIIGKVDEFAVYTGVLSSTRINAHYNNAVVPTSITIDVTTQTTTAQAQDVLVNYGTSINLSTVTATAQANDVTVVLPIHVTTDLLAVTASAQAIEPRIYNARYGSVYADYYRSGGAVVQGDDMLIDSTTDLIVFGVNLPSPFTTPNLTSIEFKVNVSAVSSAAPVTFKAAQLTAPVSNINSVSVGTPVTFVVSGTGTYTVDMLSVLDTSNFNGVVIWSDDTAVATATKTFDSIEEPVTANRPTWKATYEVVPLSVDISNPTAATSVQTQDVSVSGGTRADVSTVTASVSAQDVTVDTVITPDAIITVESVSTSLQAPDVIVSLPMVVDVTDGEVSVEAHDVTSDVTQTAIVEADTAHFTITHLGLTDVNGEPIIPSEDEDKFFTNTMRLFANRPANVAEDGIWFRLNEGSGTAVYDRFSNTQQGLYQGGVVLGLNTGPNGRRHVHFDGTGMIFQLENNLTDELYDYSSTLQFAIRTTKKDQFIMRMDDTRRGTIGSTKTGVRDIYLKDGKINFRAWGRLYNTDIAAQLQADYVGFKDIADGEWHIITLAGGAGVSGARFEVYVDDKLDFRKPGWGISFPDFIGGRSGGYSVRHVEWFDLPVADWFVGDMSEVVFLNGQHMGQDDVARQHDTLFGYDPVYPETADIITQTQDVTVKGNAKRVLCINMHYITTYLPLRGNVDRTQLVNGTIGGAAAGVFTFDGLAFAGSDNDSGVQVAGYQVFQQSAWRSDALVSFTNPVTDTQRLVDLETDLNLDDYDAISVINYPHTGYDWDLYDQLDEGVPFGALSGRQQVEKIVQDIKQFVIDGGGLFLTDPDLAVDLGVIDRVEFVPILWDAQDPSVDKGSSRVQSRDERGARINPWGNFIDNAITTIWTPRTPPYQENPTVDYEKYANFYDDEHSNNSQRVRKLVTGLTDIPGTILVDSVSSSNYRGDGEMHAEKFADRPAGLSVGDEFRIMGTRHSGRGGSFAGQTDSGFPVGPWSRYYGFPATHVSNIKVGDVVTTFSDKIWVDDVQVDNPYKDYALSVIVEPGDSLDGNVINGRIYMNFTESFANMAPFMQHGVVDVVPANEEILSPLWQETEESREWGWSMWRGQWAGNPVFSGTGGATNFANIQFEGQKENFVITDDGKLMEKPGGASNIVGINYTARYEQVSVDQPTMHYRGLKWLVDSTDSDGNATFGASALNITAKANDVTVETSKVESIELPTARTQVEANNLLDTAYSDADVLVFTAQATVRAGAFREVVELDTPNVTAKAYNDEDSTYMEADLVTVRLPGRNVILYMEDG